MLEDTIISDAIERIMRDDGGRLLASLIASLHDFQLAEDSLQDALESALVHWQRNGLPKVPSAWLLKTARHKAIDRLRRAANFYAKQSEYAHLLELESEDAAEEDEPIPDERLRLIFTCCHPALDKITRVALTLRTLGGLTTPEIARAFVVSEEAMAQRLVRARHKIAKAGIPYEVPDAGAWGDRLDGVLTVIYLIFNAGYSASSDDYIRVDLCDEAIRLVRVVDGLCAEQAEVEGLLALMLLHHSRATARLGAQNEFIPLEGQDRSLWDRQAIAEGVALVGTALRRGRPGPYQLQAAISAIHAEAPSIAETNWQEIVLIYATLEQMQSNPIFKLNRVVAMSYAHGLETALGELASISDALKNYQPYHATHADILRRHGDVDGAVIAYKHAIRLSDNDSEKQFLAARLRGLGN